MAPPMAPPPAPMPPAGIMGDPMMEMDMMMYEEAPMESEIDIVEQTLQSLAMASDGNITIKRKTKTKKKK